MMGWVDVDQERARLQRLEILEALLSAIDRRDEAFEAVVSSADPLDAAARLRVLLGVSDVAASEILNMQWRRFTQTERTALRDRRDEMREPT
jgi:DNA gyrase/topoisomerase IV subunit A